MFSLASRTFSFRSRSIYLVEPDCYLSHRRPVVRPLAHLRRTPRLVLEQPTRWFIVTLLLRLVELALEVDDLLLLGVQRLN